MYPQGCGGSSPFFGTIFCEISYIPAWWPLWCPFFLGFGVQKSWLDPRRAPRADLREILDRWRITPMPLFHNFALRKRVNLLKKVKVRGQWKLCPAVVEPNGKLKNRVRVKGKIETHPEGNYFLEWREEGVRRRLSVTHTSEVLEQARLKSLELDGGIVAAKAPQADVQLASEPNAIVAVPATGAPLNPAADALIRGLHSYIQQISVAMQSLNGNHIPADPIAHLPSVLNAQNTIGAEPCIDRVSVATGGSPQSPSDAPPTKPQKTSDSVSGSLSQAVAAYLKNVEPPQREQKTYDEYRLVLHKFLETCAKTHIKDVIKDDCMDFMRHLYSLGNEPRTVFNRIGIVLQLLKANGITGLLKRRDKPCFVQNIREMYQPEELGSLFKACDRDEKVRYLFFLLTGERDKEVRYTSWDDIDFRRKCVRVTEKKRLGFKPKDKEEREIPVPGSLLQALEEYKRRQKDGQTPNPHNLVFPTSNGKPDKKFENKLKKIARRAGLNCGRCLSKHGHECKKGPHCSKWGLHKFRHTYATTCLENGASIRTLQEWLGHSDLKSTMVYLKLVRRKDIDQLVDRSELACLAAQFTGSASLNA
jgi:integrase/recombinase XerD